MAEKNMVRVISQQDVKKCIQMKEAIELQRKAFQALSPSTKSVIPERILLSVKINEIDSANKAFEDLMGGETDARKRFIAENSLKVSNLDI